MTELMYEIPSRHDVAKVEITPDCIKGTGECNYTLLRDLPAPEIPEGLPEASDQKDA